MANLKWTIQVQAQIEVEADTFEEACDVAVDLAMALESTEWGTLAIAGPISTEPPKEMRR